MGDKRKARQRGHGSWSRGWEGDELAHRLALQTMENYAKSLRVRGQKYRKRLAHTRDEIPAFVVCPTMGETDVSRENCCLRFRGVVLPLAMRVLVCNGHRILICTKYFSP